MSAEPVRHRRFQPQRKGSPAPRECLRICELCARSARICATSRRVLLLALARGRLLASRLSPFSRREIPILAAMNRLAAAAQSAGAGRFVQSPPPPRFSFLYARLAASSLFLFLFTRT